MVSQRGKLGSQGMKAGLKRQVISSKCEQPFTELSGGVQGCPVHGIRQGVTEYLCTPCARELGYLEGTRATA